MSDTAQPPAAPLPDLHEPEATLDHVHDHLSASLGAVERLIGLARTEGREKVIESAEALRDSLIGLAEDIEALEALTP